MSGICAVWRRDGLIEPALGLISGALAQAAPETVSRELDQAAGVGVSARFDTQQVYGDARVLLACDARLYNEDELRRAEARRQGGSPGPTAALMAELYDCFGSAFVERLEGSFSVVLWDRRARKLLAAVDRFGINRLVYWQGPDGLLLASRIDALTRSGEFDVVTEPRAIARFLTFGINLAPETSIKGVQRLPPGMLFEAADGQVRLKRYWDMRYGQWTGAGEAALARDLESVVERSVAAHAASDSFAHLGAFLSGGTDSSTVVGMMSRLGRGRAKAFSIGFEEQRFNELEYAELAARRFQADHYTYLVGPDDCWEALPQIIRSFDEPFGNSSAIPTYFCARLAAQNGVRVLLAGDGGDELFGGNERYLTDGIYQMYQRAPAVVRRGVIEPVLAALPTDAGLVGKARRYVERANLPAIERYFYYSFVKQHAPSRIFTSDYLDSLGAASLLEIPSRYYAEAPASEHLDRLLYVDVKITLGDNDLPKVTRMSELAGVEARFPFLDRAVAEFSGSIPARWKVKGFEKRYLFKRAFRNLLPAEVIRKKKHGFGIPVATWLRTDHRLRELSRDVLLSQRARERGYFRRQFVEELFGLFESDSTTYYGDTVWAFLVLELWHRQFVDVPAAVAI